MTRPSYRNGDRTTGSTRSGGPIGWLQRLWGRRSPGYRSQTQTMTRSSTGGLLGRSSPDYRRPDCTPTGDQCCYTECGPCKLAPTMTSVAAEPTTVQGPVTIIVGSQE